MSGKIYLILKDNIFKIRRKKKSSGRVGLPNQNPCYTEPKQ